MISVVIPNYNRENLVVQAMSSVHAQTHRPIELIVVDDGSTDASVQCCEAWMSAHEADDFHCHLIRQMNKGGNAARNAGIEKAKGDYIGFLDSDDLWDENKLSMQMDRFTSERVGAVYCGLDEINADQSKTVEAHQRTYPSGQLFNTLLIRDVTSPTSCYLIRRKVFDTVGRFDETLQARQDWDMWIRIAEKYEIESVAEPLVHYRRHDGPRTASDPMKEINAYRSIRKKYAEQLNTLSAAERRLADSTYYKRMGRVHFHQGISTRKAIAYYFKAIALQPTDFDAWAALLGLCLPPSLRRRLHRIWNRSFGRTKLNIRSH